MISQFYERTSLLFLWLVVLVGILGLVRTEAQELSQLADSFQQQVSGFDISGNYPTGWSSSAEDWYLVLNSGFASTDATTMFIVPTYRMNYYLDPIDNAEQVLDSILHDFALEENDTIGETSLIELENRNVTLTKFYSTEVDGAGYIFPIDDKIIVWMIVYSDVNNYDAIEDTVNSIFEQIEVNIPEYNEQELNYLELRKTFETNLLFENPSHQEGSDIVGESVQQILYESNGVELKAWLALPENPISEPMPALVYLHRGFAASPYSLEVAQPFLEAGFAVFVPSYRGENGNPGNFELFYGEVDDVRAAIRWLAKQDNIDTTRIYTFGHSVGGGMSALLSLWNDIPVQFTGSSGGLYTRDVFDSWSNIVPFDVNDETERGLRLLFMNIEHMQIPHIAYLGRDDSLTNAAETAIQEADKHDTPLTIEIIRGDHFTSLSPAVDLFLETIIESWRD